MSDRTDGSVVSAARGIEDGPEPASATSPRPFSTTRAAVALEAEKHAHRKDNEYLIGEKERVYRELERVQHKCAALKRELKALRAASTAKQAATARLEARRYRQALSNIAYRLEHDGVILDEDLRSIVGAALLLRGLRARDRRRIERAREETP